MTASTLEVVLDWRYATKQFDPSAKITDANWKALEHAFLKSPSSYGLQPWKLLVVIDPELREKLKAVSWNQAQVTDASHYVVLASKEKMDAAHIARHVDRVAEMRGLNRATLTAYEGMMVGDLLKGPRASEVDAWARNQTYIAMGFLLQAAATLKIDACPMEGLDPKTYNELLNLEGTGYKTVASIAFGYRSPNDRYQFVKKVRFPHAEVIEYR